MDVRRCTEADLDAISAVFVAGFAGDPWFRWLWPGAEYEACAHQWFRLVAEVTVPKGHCCVAGDGTAAALWVPPGVPTASPEDLARAAALLSEQIGDRAGEALAALGASAASAPAEPHYACLYVAVRPERWGRGLGGAVMAPALAEADAGGLGAHLVSTNERNLGFYRRLGFEVTGEVAVAGGAVTFRPMVREPRHRREPGALD